MEPGANRLVQAHAARDRVDHKDNKRDEGEHDDDFLSRSHAGDLILARRSLEVTMRWAKVISSRLGLGSAGLG